MKETAQVRHLDGCQCFDCRGVVAAPKRAAIASAIREQQARESRVCDLMHEIREMVG